MKTDESAEKQSTCTRGAPWAVVKIFLFYFIFKKRRTAILNDNNIQSATGLKESHSSRYS